MQKKIVFKVTFLAVLMLLFFIVGGCSKWLAKTDQSEVLPKEREEIENFAVQYIRTNGYVEGASFPKTVVIGSVAELEAYYEANKEIYSLTESSFYSAMAAYDEAFFENNALIFVLLEEPSGSIKHRVAGLWVTDDELEIEIERTVPQMGTADMAEWHIVIEMAAKNIAEKESSVSFTTINE